MALNIQNIMASVVTAGQSPHGKLLLPSVAIGATGVSLFGNNDIEQSIATGGVIAAGGGGILASRSIGKWAGMATAGGTLGLLGIGLGKAGEGLIDSAHRAVTEGPKTTR